LKKRAVIPLILSISACLAPSLAAEEQDPERGEARAELRKLEEPGGNMEGGDKK